MAHKKYDAVATIGEYTDRNGATKKRYVNVGTVFENDKGQLSLKMDVVPVGQEWSGWISFFEPKPRDGQPAPQPARQAVPAPARTHHDDADDIPF